jgi:hypothetical protein
MAVSKGREIFSWHGANEFSSDLISDVVARGVISSGNFVGFLSNIFLVPEVHFAFRGHSHESGRETLRFEYVVPQAISRYCIGGSKESAIVPFHGRFAVNKDTLELVDLTIIADKIPPVAELCAAETGVRFQMVEISGHQTLIPSRFELRTTNDASVHTVSRGDYTDCHEFKTESKLRFDLPEGETGEALVKPEPTRVLRERVDLPLVLATPVNGSTAFAGDSVEARLTEPVTTPDGISLPPGAVLHGTITQLELHSEKEECWFLRVDFDRLVAGRNAYYIHAVHKRSAKDEQALKALYGGAEPPRSVVDEIDNGTMIIRGSRLHLDQRFAGEWETTARLDEKANQTREAR